MPSYDRIDNTLQRNTLKVLDSSGIDDATQVDLVVATEQVGELQLQWRQSLSAPCSLNPRRSSCKHPPGTLRHTGEPPPYAATADQLSVMTAGQSVI